MNFNNVKVPKVPGGGAASALIKFGVVAGLGVYGVANSLYNVDGGHRAIVFNRLVGVKDKVLFALILVILHKKLWKTEIRLHLRFVRVLYASWPVCYPSVIFSLFAVPFRIVLFCLSINSYLSSYSLFPHSSPKS